MELFFWTQHRSTLKSGKFTIIISSKCEKCKAQNRSNSPVLYSVIIIKYYYITV